MTHDLKALRKQAEEVAAFRTMAQKQQLRHVGERFEMRIEI